MDRSFLDKFNIDFHLTVGVSAWYSVTLKNVRVRLVFVHSSVKLLNLANGSGHVTEFWRDTIMCRKQQRHFDTILELALLNSIVLLHVFIESKEIAFHRLLGPYTVLPKSDPPEIWELLSKTLDWVWKKATFFFFLVRGGGYEPPVERAIVEEVNDSLPWHHYEWWLAHRWSCCVDILLSARSWARKKISILFK